MTNPKIDEREVLADLFSVEPHLLADRAGQLILADKGYTSAVLEEALAQRGATLLHPAYRNRAARPGEHLLKTVRQLIESVFDTLKDQLGLERHHGRTVEGVGVQVAQRVLALTAAIWHNNKTGQPIARSLIAYDH